MHKTCAVLSLTNPNMEGEDRYKLPSWTEKQLAIVNYWERERQVF